MEVGDLDRIIAELSAKAGPDAGLKALWRQFMQLEEALGCASGETADDLIARQSRVIEMVCRLPAAGPAGIAYKLAIWRAEADLSVKDVTRHEYLALNALNDAVQIAALDELKASDE